MTKSDLSWTTQEREQFWEEVGVLNDRNHNVNMLKYYVIGLGNSLYVHYRVTTFRVDKQFKCLSMPCILVLKKNTEILDAFMFMNIIGILLCS